MSCKAARRIETILQSLDSVGNEVSIRCSECGGAVGVAFASAGNNRSIAVKPVLGHDDRHFRTGFAAGPDESALYRIRV